MNSPENKIYDVAIVGAGAAGQMAAIAAAQSGAKVILLEKMDRMGLKILASGGGRCNFTNLVPHDQFVDSFGRQGRFMGPALDLLGPEKLRDFFAQSGIPTVAEGLQVYPESHRSSDIEKALQNKIKSLGVSVELGCCVEKLLIESGELKGIQTDQGRQINAKAVILACGGMSYPNLGGSNIGYSLVKQVGHKMVQMTPAGVGLITAERWTAELAGVQIPNARVRIPLPRQPKAGIKGDILFTHRGISGPAILNISAAVSRLLINKKSVPLEIELVDGMTPAKWQDQFSRWRKSKGKILVTKLLSLKIPASLARHLVAQINLDNQTAAANMPKQQTEKLAKTLGQLQFTITSTEGFDSAFVTSGGVKLKEVNPNTLESRIQPGLFLAGEILDLDGPCGGYNLQWAFASGYLAGQSAV